MKRSLDIGDMKVGCFVYYDPGRDSRERSSFYSSLHSRVETLRNRKARKWEKPSDIVDEVMSGYRNFISWRYSDGFILKMKENTISQRVNRCGITIIAFTGDHDACEILDEYRKRDSVEKMFIASKSFTGAEPLRVHSLETLRGELFVNLIALAIRSRVSLRMRDSGLMKKYSVEKMLLELQKIRKVILQDGKEIMTEVTKRQKEILEKLSVPLDQVPTFLKS
ncbi:MAG: IS1634 family transposase [Thermoplasmataceae archaeon]